MKQRIAAIVLSVLLPIQIEAHTGHQTARVAAQVVSAHMIDKTVHLVVRLRALETGNIRLLAASAMDAHAVGWQVSSKIGRQGWLQHAITLKFTTDVPEIFTTLLDFGEAGQGPLLVVLD
ncbi:MAG: hypothetical protein AAF754_00145 [Pseudomonadota bacterium]